MVDAAPAPAPRRGGADHPRLHSLRELLRFGFPTVPADASVFALNVVDRYYLFHKYGAATAGLYSLAVKLAGVVAFVVRAFQYSWPPLAYSIKDDDEAARFYAFVATYYVLVDRLGGRRPAAARPLARRDCWPRRTSTRRTRRSRGWRSAGRSTACS